MSHGYEVIPVNPNHDEVLGRKCYARLADVPGEIDLVNVFRRPQFCADVTREAIAIGAKGVWLQAGIRNEEAQKLAEEAGDRLRAGPLHHGRAHGSGGRDFRAFALQRRVATAVDYTGSMKTDNGRTTSLWMATADTPVGPALARTRRATCASSARASRG